MSIRAFVVGVFWLAACVSPVPKGTTTHYLLIEQGRRAWPVQDQALVRNVEERLEALGFDPGRADGVAEPQTTQALTAFQRSRGLAATGILDEETARLLGLRWSRVSADVRAGRLELM
jgi:Putative peptidoglycan binding domain